MRMKTGDSSRKAFPSPPNKRDVACCQQPNVFLEHKMYLGQSKIQTPLDIDEY
jgi:hypothetical protein